MTGIRARPGRVTQTRGKRRRAARITFALSAPGRVVFVVRGPAPSCGVVGRFSVRGTRGLNRVLFTGRLGRRTLGPGAYRITAKTRTGAATRPVVVVIEPSRTERRFACSEPRPEIPEIFASLSGSFASPGDASPGGGTRPAAESTAANSRGEAGAGREESGSGVLPAVKDGLSMIPEALPELQGPNDSSSPSSILGIGALLLLALSALALLLYVLRFLRRPHTT